MPNLDTLIVIGKVTGAFGVKGWVKVYTYTAEPEAIFSYQPWHLQRNDTWQQVKLVSGKRQGKALVAQLEGVEDRDQALALVGAEIAVSKTQLPALSEGEYYWSDLEGLQVITTTGVMLGKVDHLLETGANDVMIVKGDRERWLPWLMGSVIQHVDLDKGIIRVDWDPEF